MEQVNLAEFEEVARAKLRREAYDYYAGGANDEVTLRANREAYGKLSLYHRVLRDVAARDTSVEVLGERISFPVMVRRRRSSAWRVTRASAPRHGRRLGLGRSW